MTVVWLASLFIIGGVALGIWGFRPAPVDLGNNLEDPDFLAPSARDIELQDNPVERIFLPAMNAIASSVRRFTPAGWLDSLDHTLRVGNVDKKWTPEIVLGIQAAGFGLGSLLAFAYLSSAGGARMNVIMALLFVGVLTFGPKAKVTRTADDRRKAVLNELPDVLDQLTVTVEAGMSFDGALLRAGQEGRGVLAGELLHCVHDMQLGLSRGEALQALAERTDVPDLRAFVSAVRQAEKHGFPIANILRLQSQEMREKRRARAEERAMQVPVKITFPLVFCILPALFIVILGPAVIQVAENF